MYTLLTSYKKNEIFFTVWIFFSIILTFFYGLDFFSITLMKKVDFDQASPSYEVAMEISKGKEKAMVLIFGC